MEGRIDMSGKIILLIEDEQDIRAVYAEVLRDEGYVVTEAADGDEGLKKALDERWDLMLLDVMLPGEDGLHILKSVKENERVKGRPVILLTNLGNESVINEAFRVHADGFLIKSQITPDRIVKEVNQFLQN